MFIYLSVDLFVSLFKSYRSVVPNLFLLHAYFFVIHVSEYYPLSKYGVATGEGTLAPTLSKADTEIIAESLKKKFGCKVGVCIYYEMIL